MQLGGSAAPTPADRKRWRAADLAQRPGRLDAVRSVLAERSLDAYFGLRPENARYLTGFVLADGEDRVAGASGRFLVSADEAVVLADSRYRLQAEQEAAGSRVEDISRGFVSSWANLLASLKPISATDGRLHRVGVEADHLDHASWLKLAAATPDVELVAIEGIIEGQRTVKAPEELERIKAACAIADGALQDTLADITDGVSERELALALEWRMRTGGADALAFDVACLAGPRAALPHGTPTDRAVSRGEVLLFDFGAQVDGYRSDMTRTLFVGEPDARDAGIYELVERAQAGAMELLEAALRSGDAVSNRQVDAAARDVIEAGGHGQRFGHGTGHGIGLATHELPSINRSAPEQRLPAPTVFSVEPGVYLDGETGVRIEDLVVFDRDSGVLETLTRFPREITVVGA